MMDHYKVKLDKFDIVMNSTSSLLISAFFAFSMIIE